MKFSIAATALLSSTSSAVVAASTMKHSSASSNSNNNGGQTTIISHKKKQQQHQQQNVGTEGSSSTVTLQYDPTSNKRTEIMNQLMSARSSSTPTNANAKQNKKAVLQQKLRQAFLKSQDGQENERSRRHHSRVLRNSDSIECELPADTTTTEEADLGVLDQGMNGCGPTQYCIESVTSSLGGYCVEDSPYVTTTVGAGDASAARQLEDVATDAPLLGYVDELCNVTLAEEIGYSCDCEETDPIEYTGSAMCMTESYSYSFPTVCGDQLPNVTFAYMVQYNVVVTAPFTGSAQFCYQLTEPQQIEYCYSYELNGLTDAPTCTMSLNGVDCTSCLPFDYDTTDDFGLPVTLSCKEFDCSNTEFAVSGSLCDPTSLSQYIFTDILVYDYLPCPDACFLCGSEGLYTGTPDAPFGGADNTCGLIELAALAGYPVVVDMCETLGMDFQASCTCIDPNAPTDVPVDTPMPGTDPTDAPVMTPTDMPVPAPTDAPVDSPPSGATTIISTTAAMAVTAVAGIMAGFVMVA